MPNWKNTTLNKVIQFNPKEQIPKKSIAKKVAMEHLQPFTKYITKYELAEFKGGAKFRNGDTLLARITPCLENGKTSQVTILGNAEVGFGSTEYIVLRNIEGISDKDYIYYLATSSSFRDIAIKSMVGSSGRQRVQQSVLENTAISLPPLEEQKSIAAILSALDDKIELNNQINKNLEAQAQAIFKSWFVDFEPWGGVMPSDWRDGRLEECIELFDYKRVPLSGSERDKMRKIYPYYGAATVVDYVDDYLFDGIYLLFSEDGANVVDINGYPLLQYVWGKFWLNNHAHIMKGKNGFSVEILYVLLKTTNVKAAVTGAVQPKINQENLKKIKILIPKEEVLLKYDDVIKPIFTMIRKNQEEAKAICKIRDSLLPKLMSGELTPRLRRPPRRRGLRQLPIYTLSTASLFEGGGTKCRWE